MIIKFTIEGIRPDQVENRKSAVSIKYGSSTSKKEYLADFWEALVALYQHEKRMLGFSEGVEVID